MTEAELGVRLMELRKRRKMSMRELAERSGASTSFISQVETGRTNPTVSKLQNLATALGVPVNYFFDPHTDAPSEPPDAEPRPIPAPEPALPPTRTPTNSNMPVHTGVPPELVRSSDRAEFKLDHGVTWARLTPHGRNGIEFLEVTYDVGADSGPLASHYGEEFVLIAEGSLEVTFAFETLVLEAGDSLVIDSTVPHAVRNVGDVPVRAIWVNWSRSGDAWPGSMR